MLDQICAHIHNWFCDESDIRTGTWTIANGAIDMSGIVLEGQYFRIVGSALNDGVYLYPPTPAEGEEPILADETFTGEIWPMKVPKAVRQLADEIAAWQTKYGAAMASPFQSENIIGVYSYTKHGGNTSVNGTSAEADGWKSAFKSRLNPWRKLR